MKYLLMVALALSSVPAGAKEIQAVECSAISRQDHEGANFLLYPYMFLQKNDGGEIEAMMVTEGAVENSFGDRICQLCGWGSSASALRFKGGKVSGGPFAFFDGSGRLVSIGLADDPVQVVESLTCR